MPAPAPRFESESLLARLRSATSARHATLDRALGPAVSRSRASYARFLASSFVAVTALEGAVERSLGDGHRARRGALIRTDLEALGVAIPPCGPTYELEDEAAAFGCAYVIEGSALGGVVLARNVRDELGSDVSTAYLALRGVETTARWRWFLTELDAFSCRAGDVGHAGACRAAVAAFGIYGAAFARAGRSA